MPLLVRYAHLRFEEPIISTNHTANITTYPTTLNRLTLFHVLILCKWYICVHINVKYNMLLTIFRFLWGYNYEWEEYERFTFNNGIEILFICKKTGRMKKVFIG